jgi:hypothetical protein
MADVIDPNDPLGIMSSGPIPDVPQTALAFRTWRLGDNGRLLSINAPSLTGKAGGNANSRSNNPRSVPWIQRAMASDGQDGWPIGGPLVAVCGRLGQNAEKTESHGKIPAKGCTCGIYATTNIKVIDRYLGNEVVDGIALRGPVLGVVEMGGSVRPATQGYRAAYARVAGIIKIGSEFSLSGPQLQQIAAFYKVPLLKDVSVNPEDYRKDIEDAMPAMTDDDTGIGDEAEEFLAELMKDEGGEDDG